MSEPTIRRFLDLSNNHLPVELGSSGLEYADGVIAWPTDHGWLMWVPSDPDDSNLYDDPPPDVVQEIHLYARKHDCDYVLFDAEGPVDDNLPAWEW